MNDKVARVPFAFLVDEGQLFPFQCPKAAGLKSAQIGQRRVSPRRDSGPWGALFWQGSASVSTSRVFGRYLRER